VHDASERWTRIYTHTHTHMYARPHAWPCITRKSGKTPTDHKSRLGAFVATASLERLCGQRSRGVRASLIISRGIAVLVFGNRRLGNASRQVSLNSESIESSRNRTVVPLPRSRELNSRRTACIVYIQQSSDIPRRCRTAAQGVRPRRTAYIVSIQQSSDIPRRSRSTAQGVRPGVHSGVT